MTGKLYIDNIDAYSTYGVFVASGGYNELIAFHPLKNIQSNNWMEEDGIETDLLHPALDTQEFRMNFVSHSKNKLGDFFDLLSDMAYHIFDFREVGRVYKLRLVSQSGLNRHRDMNVFSLQLANDFPLSDSYVYASPQSNIFGATGYRIDGLDLSQYGIYILQGSAAEVLKSAQVKKNLTRNFSNVNGVEYDGDVVFFQSKEATLNCLMRAHALVEFWRNYDALLYDLVRPNERTLSVDFTGEDYPCYYKSCKAKGFYPIDKIWFEFGLTLVFSSFRVKNLP